jgi:hypothetical protein
MMRMDQNREQRQNEYVPDEAEDMVDPENVADADTLPDGNQVGADNIREGRVGGVMGGPNQQQGEGQGG